MLTCENSDFSHYFQKIKQDTKRLVNLKFNCLLAFSYIKLFFMRHDDFNSIHISCYFFFFDLVFVLIEAIMIRLSQL